MEDVKCRVRNTRSSDFAGIIRLSLKIYPESNPWKEEQLASHLQVFPEGQFVAEDTEKNTIVGTSSSLIIYWNDYNIRSSWRDFTDKGYFRNHDPQNGRTLYGADVMVDPEFQGHGVGTQIYDARRELTRSKGLLRIRAGSRIRGYHTYAKEMSADEYTLKVVKDEIYDPTLTFQLHRGFRVLAVVPNYLRHDPESLGYAAIIEWLNPEVAKPEDLEGFDPRFSPDLIKS